MKQNKLRERLTVKSGFYKNNAEKKANFKRDFKVLQELKKISPSKTTYKNLLSGYKKERFEIETLKDRPVNNVFENLKDFHDRNPNIKIYLKQKGETEFQIISFAAAEIVLAKLNSELWRKGIAQKKLGNNAYIPQMEITSAKSAKSEVPTRYYIDFNAANFSDPENEEE